MKRGGRTAEVAVPPQFDDRKGVCEGYVSAKEQRRRLGAEEASSAGAATVRGLLDREGAAAPLHSQ